MSLSPPHLYHLQLVTWTEKVAGELALFSLPSLTSLSPPQFHTLIYPPP